MRWHEPVVILSALLIFQPAQRASLVQYVYAALGRIHAGLDFVLRGDIATPSMVRARSRYSDAHTMLSPPHRRRALGEAQAQAG